MSLFRRDQGTGGVEDDFEAHLLAQDVIYVGGGNVVSMLGAWRAHGLDEILRRAWRKGVVLCGPSAGSLCWFDEALSAFRGAPRSVRGLGLLPYSNCVHYDAEPERRAEYHRFVRDGMCAGFAVEDGVALHFRRTRLKRAVSSRPDGHAYLVQPGRDGVVETPVEVSFLGAAGALETAAKDALEQVGSDTSPSARVPERIPPMRTRAARAPLDHEADAPPAVGLDTRRTAPETSRAAPETSRTAPQASRAAPDTSRAAPETSRAAPETSRAAPETSRAAPETSRTAPEPVPA